MRRAAIVLAGALLAAVPAAFAHPLGPSLLELRERAPGIFQLRWKTPLQKVPGAEARPVVPESCAPIGEPVHGAAGEGVVEIQKLDCGAAGLVGREVSVAGIAETKADVLLRVELADGRSFRKVLTAAEPALVIPERESRATVFGDYLAVGIEHIATGFDHLLFVLGLVFLASGRKLFWTVTAFTLGHSVTLSLAVLGFAAFPTRPIEAAIAASILVLADELTREGPTLSRRFPWVMAATFGLLHGLGFAGALAEVGLPAGDIPLALFSFNAGIEVGQLGFVAAVLAVGAAARRASGDRLAALRLAPAYVIGSASAFWLFERLAAL